MNTSRHLRALQRWEVVLLLLLILAVAAGAYAVPGFGTAENASAATASLMEVAIIALPSAMIIIMGDIDLSVGSVVALSSALFGRFVQDGMPLATCVILVLLSGALAGAINALLIVRLGLPSLVVTLGTLILFAGLAQAVLDGTQVSRFPSVVTDFGYGYIPETLVPWPLPIFMLLLVASVIVLHVSELGRQIYAIGSNSVAARFSGVRTGMIRAGLFITSGTVASLAGMLLTARLGSARADNGSTILLAVLATVLLGGVSVFGGKGNLAGVVLALLLLATLQNIMGLKNVPSNVQQVAVGVLLIFSVLATDGLGRLKQSLSGRRASGASAEPSSRARPS